MVARVRRRAARPGARAQDSDERACAYIAGAAPPRWGRFGAAWPMQAPAVVAAPGQLAVAATAAEQAAAREVRRAHPLYADVTLRLLTEILNSRLFTTARRPARPARARARRSGCMCELPRVYV